MNLFLVPPELQKKVDELRETSNAGEGELIQQVLALAVEHFSTLLIQKENTADYYKKAYEEKADYTGRLLVRSEALENELARRPKDDPELDATDGAHPAWWRGHEDGVRGATERVADALEKPPSEGVLGYEPLQNVVEDIHRLRANLKFEEERVERLMNLPPGEGPAMTALGTLVALKAIKDNPAASEEEKEFYEGSKPDAWKRAKEVVDGRCVGEYPGLAMVLHCFEDKEKISKLKAEVTELQTWMRGFQQ